MNRPRKPVDLPPAGRPKLVMDDQRMELNYLGWGLRSFGRHPTATFRHDDWSYSLILRGSPTIHLEDGPHRLGPDRVVLVGPSRTYRFGFSDAPDALSEVLIWTWRTPPLVTQIAPPESGHLLFRVNVHARKRIKAIHTACRREAVSPDQFTLDMLRGFRLQLDTELARQRSVRATQADWELLTEMAVGWMEQNLDSVNPVFLLSDYLQISRSTLNELFRRAFGQSPSVYHRRMRMEKARQLLDGGQTMKETAFALGYRHANDFSRAYRTFRPSCGRVR